MRIGIYPGSFDPITLGHYDIIVRAANLVDKLIIGVLNNSSKKPLFSVDERVDMIKKVTAELDNVEVEAFDGLLVEYATIKGANVIIRGLRAVSDFEYELQIAQTNHKLNKEVETIFLAASTHYPFISSSVVKEIARYRADISKFVPELIERQIYEKFKE